MSGRLVAVLHPDGLLVRKRYYPALVTLWTLLLMGGVCYLSVTLSGDRGFGVLACLIGTLISTVIIGLALYMEGRPPLIDWNSADRKLFVHGRPLEGEYGSPLRMAVGDVDFSLGGTCICGEALYVLRPDKAGFVPVYVEHGRPGIRRKLSCLEGKNTCRLGVAPAVKFT